ncbi:MAG: hypothetical protein BHW44_02425 [Roseburia sp. 40_7]|nr:MAG: hypothetical protein BHW44_02425 [Roseburia sp. 40_7]
MREKEADITEENVLSICLDNSEFRTDRKVNSSEYQSAVFDCNIQQVKPDLFNYLYYGLFFEDRVAVFEMSSDDMLEFYTAKHFSSAGKRLEKVDPWESGELPGNKKDIVIISHFFFLKRFIFTLLQSVGAEHKFFIDPLLQTVCAALPMPFFRSG